MSSPAGQAPRSMFGAKAALWLTLAAALCVGFVLLGNWQMRRLSWKLKLIHDVDTRVEAPPQAAPGPALWPEIRAGHLQYLHVRLTGHFAPDTPTLVHGTSPDGYGYWLMAPFRTTDGFTVLVNRGYVPATWGEPDAAPRLVPPAGTETLTGLLRFTEPEGGFLRRNRPAAGQWYSRDISAIGHARGLPPIQLAPYFVDADARPDGPRWPAAGLTKIHFRNAHLGYAMTWYGMALAVFGAAIWLVWRTTDTTPPTKNPA